MAATLNGTTNCNFAYMDWLSTYEPNNMAQALFDVFTSTNAFARPPQPRYYFSLPTAGMILFAQGSEHKAEIRPYAHNMKKLIESEALGKVHEMPPVPNPLHNNKPGILFIWIVDHVALGNWYKKKAAQGIKSTQEQARG